jgi:inhibitor of KinA sporulation pathway (predicted exonuclease)
VSLEHTSQSGIDVIATFQETEDSQLRIMEAVEFEYRFENYLAHEHNPKQTSLIICWEIRDNSKLQRVCDYYHRAEVDGEIVPVFEISRFPGVRIKKRSEIAW